MAQIRKGKGEGKADGRNSGGRGDAAIAGGEEVAGAIDTGPTGHDLMNRGRREREEVKAISHRPRTRPEDTADAVVTMVDDAKVPGARELGPRGHYS